MKTPEEIAAEIASGYHENVRHSAYSAAHEAITADRAQNPGPSFEELDDMLEEWENYSGDVSAFIQRFVGRWER